MGLREQLAELFEKYELDLSEFAWASEESRWSELVFCLADRGTSLPPEQTRKAVDTLRASGLLQVERMAQLIENTSEPAIAFRYILKHHGFDDDESDLTVRLLAGLTKALSAEHEGKVQHLLRQHAEAMRDELVAAFDQDLMPIGDLRYAITHWLQNTTSLPISLRSQAVVDFCNENGVTLEELWRAADLLDLNVAVVDDLVELDRQAKETEGLTS